MRCVAHVYIARMHIPVRVLSAFLAWKNAPAQSTRMHGRNAAACERWGGHSEAWSAQSMYANLGPTKQLMAPDSRFVAVNSWPQLECSSQG